MYQIKVGGWARCAACGEGIFLIHSARCINSACRACTGRACRKIKVCVGGEGTMRRSTKHCYTHCTCIYIYCWYHISYIISVGTRLRRAPRRADLAARAALAVALLLPLRHHQRPPPLVLVVAAAAVVVAVGGPHWGGLRIDQWQWRRRRLSSLCPPGQAIPFARKRRHRRRAWAWQAPLAGEESVWPTSEPVSSTSTAQPSTVQHSKA